MRWRCYGYQIQARSTKFWSDILISDLFDFAINTFRLDLAVHLNKTNTFSKHFVFLVYSFWQSRLNKLIKQ